MYTQNLMGIYFMKKPHEFFIIFFLYHILQYAHVKQKSTHCHQRSEILLFSSSQIFFSQITKCFSNPPPHDNLKKLYMHIFSYITYLYIFINIVL